MSYHSTLNWAVGDEVTDVVGALKYHLELNDGEQYTPGAYIKFNAVDACIYFVGKILDAQARGDDVDLEKLTASSSESARELITRVMARMGDTDGQ